MTRLLIIILLLAVLALVLYAMLNYTERQKVNSFLKGIFVKYIPIVKDKLERPLDAIGNFVEKVKNPETREKMKLKENWVLWLSWSAFGIFLGANFYIGGFVIYLALNALIFLNIIKRDKKETKIETVKSVNTEDIVDEEISNQDKKHIALKVYEYSKNAIKSFFIRSYYSEKRKEMEVEEYILFMMVSTLPFSIGAISVDSLPFDLPVGIILYVFAVLGLLGVMLIELITGHEFVSLADLRTRGMELHTTDLEKQLVKKDAEIESLNKQLDTAEKKTGDVIVKFNSLETDILGIASMTRCKDEIKPALAKLKAKLSERKIGGDKTIVK